MHTTFAHLRLIRCAYGEPSIRQGGAIEPDDFVLQFHRHTYQW